MREEKNNKGGETASCSDDKTVIVWQADKDQLWHNVCTLSGHHTRTIYSVDINRNEEIATGAGDDHIRIFELVFFLIIILILIF